MKFRQLGSALVCWSLMTSAAFADCVQADLAGLWELYFPAQQPGALGGADYSRCRMNVDSAGTILSDSYCLSFAESRSPVTNGTMTMRWPHSCAFQFQFASPASVPGYKATHGTLTKDLSSAAGIMTFPVGNQRPKFLFMMVRL